MERESTLRQRMTSTITGLDQRAEAQRAALMTTEQTLSALRYLRDALIRDEATLTSVESAMTLLRKAGIE